MASAQSPDIELSTRTLKSGVARSAIFQRRYHASIAEVWDVCTNPERLARWYAPVKGELRVGGRFTQGDFGDGHVARCEPPHYLEIELGGATPATDVVYLSLTSDGDATVLRFEHATTLTNHNIAGGVYDAVYCMGGGYPPRLESLQRELDHELPDNFDPSVIHLQPEYRPCITDSMGRIAQMLIPTGVSQEFLGG